MEIGARIQQLRKARGITQGDVERTTGLLRSYLSRLEHGRLVPSLTNLERLAAALGVTVCEILSPGETAPAGPTATGGVDQEAERRFYSQLEFFVVRIPEQDRKLFLTFAKNLAARGKTTATPAAALPSSVDREQPDVSTPGS